MLEIQGDIFDFIADPTVNAICITTNGVVNWRGLACMGAGTAGEMARRYPQVRSLLGKLIKYYGNKVQFVVSLDRNGKWLGADENGSCMVFSFPTKDHFNDPSIPNLIVKSAKKLLEISNNLNLKKIMLPVPGCGPATGKLNWEKDVKPLLIDILDDRFHIVFLGELK